MQITKIWKGEIPMPPVAAPGEPSYEMWDNWTWGHLATGAITRLLNMTAAQSFIVALLWELYEPWILVATRSFWTEKDIRVDTPRNVTGDLIAHMAGWFVVSKLAK